MGVEGCDGGAAGREGGRFDTEKRGGEITAAGDDRNVHGEVVAAELPAPFAARRRLSEEGEPIVVGAPLTAGRARRLGQRAFRADNADDGGVAVGAQGRCQELMHGRGLGVVQVANPDTVAPQGTSRQVRPIGPRRIIERQQGHRALLGGQGIEEGLRRCY